MVQPELWAAAALMLLGAAVSLCIRCQLSGEFGVLPAVPAALSSWNGPPGVGLVVLSFAPVGMLSRLEQGGKEHPKVRPPCPGAGVTPRGAEPGPCQRGFGTPPGRV